MFSFKNQGDFFFLTGFFSNLLASLCKFQNGERFVLKAYTIS